MEEQTQKNTVLKLARLNSAIMTGFDTALGAVSLFKPDLMERFLGLKSDKGGRAMLQRTSLIWFSYAAAHLVSVLRGSSADWQVLAWMRAVEIPADPIWAMKNNGRVSPFGKGILMAFTPACNTGMTVLFSAAAKQAKELEAAEES